MSIAGLVGASRTHTDTNAYDHAITLVDATKPTAEREEAEETPEDSDASPSGKVTGASLGRKWTKSTLREELARRKYARWQEARLDDDEVAAGLKNDGETDVPEEQVENVKKTLTSNSRFRDKITFRSKKKAAKSKAKDDTYVDILYENQRGWFLCGIPLYSSKSLLPTDPASWQNGAYKESPVNITNAQLPDPSWGWAWRRWYADMSYDVDEEGWQYSFNFSQGYAWHGNHPWFHSFVRRRRWLRKRVKIHPLKPSSGAGKLAQSHLLNEDYFTIHTSRNRSRDSSMDRTGTKRSSFLSAKTNSDSEEEDIGDITDILKLMVALRRARVDREKMSAVKKFVDQGGEDLIYLADRMLNIMRSFIYRTSQQQLRTWLQQALDDVDKQNNSSEGEVEAEKEAVQKKADNLIKAIHSADSYLRKESLADITKDLGSTNDSSTFPSNEGPGEEGTTIADEIKGISEDAEISEEPGIRRPGQGPESSTTKKGKEKA